MQSNDPIIFCQDLYECISVETQKYAQAKMEVKPHLFFH